MNTASKPPLGVVFLVLFLDLVGFGIVFPLYAAMLDWYGAHDQGLMSWIMGLVDACWPGASSNQRAALFGGGLAALYAGLQFVSAPIWGRLSDRFGRRPILVMSLCGSLIANVLWVFSADFTVLLLARIIAGAMTGNVGVATAAVADVTDERTRGRGLAIIGMAFGLGFILGPAIGGLTAGIRLDDPTAQVGAFALHPFSTPALVAAVLAAVNLVWAFWKFPETLAPANRGRQTQVRVLNPLQIFAPELGVGAARVNTAVLLHTLLFAGMEATLVFLAQDRLGMTPLALGGLFAWMGLVSALSQGIFVRRLISKIGGKPLAFAGLLVLSPGFLVIGLVDLSPQPWLMWVGITILAVGTGLVFPSLNALASLAAPADRQGWAMGAFRSAGAFGRAVGPLGGALTYFLLTPFATYLVCAVGIIVPALIIRSLPDHRAAD